MKDTNHIIFCVLRSGRSRGPGKGTRGKTQIILDFVSCDRPAPGARESHEGKDTNHLKFCVLRSGRPGARDRHNGEDTTHIRFCVLRSGRPRGPWKDTRGKTQIIVNRRVARVGGLSLCLLLPLRKIERETERLPLSHLYLGERRGKRETITQPPLH